MYTIIMYIIHTYLSCLSLVFQYEKSIQSTDPPYFSFCLVIGQLSAYIWSLSSLEIEKERERSQKPKRVLAFF